MLLSDILRETWHEESYVLFASHNPCYDMTHVVSRILLGCYTCLQVWPPWSWEVLVRIMSLLIYKLVCLADLKSNKLAKYSSIVQTLVWALSNSTYTFGSSTFGHTSLKLHLVHAIPPAHQSPSLPSQNVKNYLSPHLCLHSQYSRFSQHYEGLL